MTGQPGVVATKGEPLRRVSSLAEALGHPLAIEGLTALAMAMLHAYAGEGAVTVHRSLPHDVRASAEGLVHTRLGTAQWLERRPQGG